MPETLRPVPRLLTVGQIVDRLNEPLHRVEYVIKTREVKPSGMAGHARVFEEHQVEEIASALRDIDLQREGRR